MPPISVFTLLLPVESAGNISVPGLLQKQCCFIRNTENATSINAFTMIRNYSKNIINNTKIKTYNINIL